MSKASGIKILCFSKCRISTPISLVGMAWLCLISIMVECELIFLFEILAERLKNHEPAVETVFDLLELEDSAR